MFGCVMQFTDKSKVPRPADIPSRHSLPSSSAREIAAMDCWHRKWLVPIRSAEIKVYLNAVSLSVCSTLVGLVMVRMLGVAAEEGLSASEAGVCASLSRIGRNNCLPCHHGVSFAQRYSFPREHRARLTVSVPRTGITQTEGNGPNRA